MQKFVSSLMISRVDQSNAKMFINPFKAEPHFLILCLILYSAYLDYGGCDYGECDYGGFYGKCEYGE